MPVKIVRMMDNYGKRVDEIETRRLEEVRDAALRLASDIQKVLKKRDEQEAKVGK